MGARFSWKYPWRMDLLTQEQLCFPSPQTRVKSVKSFSGLRSSKVERTIFKNFFHCRQRWNDLPEKVLDLGLISFPLAVASADGNEDYDDSGDDEVKEEQMERTSDLANGQRRSRSKGSHKVAHSWWGWWQRWCHQADNYDNYGYSICNDNNRVDDVQEDGLWFIVAWKDTTSYAKKLNIEEN